MAMTVFLYPIFRKDSKELAMGMVLFPWGIGGNFLFSFDPRFFSTGLTR